MTYKNKRKAGGEAMAFGRVRQACISRRKLLPPRPPSCATNLISENIDKQFPSRYNHIIVNGL